MTKETNIDQSVSNVVEMDISDELQQIITDNMFWLKRRSRVRQADLAKSLGISQPTLSQKYSRTVAWTINDLAKAAVFFKVPVSYLVTDNFIEPSSEYQSRHYGETDIPRRELSAPAGARYLRKPDENESRPHGAVGPRAFVMPLDVDQMNLGPRFSARTRFKLPRMCQRPKAIMDALADHLGDIGLEDGWDDPHVAADGSIQCGCLAEFPDITAWRAHLATAILKALSRISS